MTAINAPRDKYNAVWIIFFILGLATLLPWNFFMTATMYFTERLKDAPANVSAAGAANVTETRNVLESKFNNVMTLCAMVPLLIFTCLNSFIHQRIPQKLRISGCLAVILLVFMVTAIFVKVDMAPLPFFTVTMIKIVCINSFGAIFQGSLFGLAGILPASYTTPIMSGQGLAGTFAAICMICALATGSKLQDSAFGYFVTACVVIVLSIMSYFTLPRMEFFQYYMESNGSRPSADEENKMDLLKKENPSEEKQGGNLTEEENKSSVSVLNIFKQTRPVYCRINLSVPVLERFFNQEDPRPDFRLSRESLAVLLNLLNQERRHGWGATIETLVFLFWLASGTSYRVVSRVFGMPRSTVHYIVHRLTEEVVAIRHKVIYLPKTPEQLDEVSRGFAGMARHRAFLKAAGAIDGCHIRMKPPSGPDGQCYRNRKLFPSVILQAVCNHQGRFIDTYVGWPGSVHDSRVLRHSPLYVQSSYPPPGYFILADGGYPCLQSPLPLITPYKRQVQGVGAQRFNHCHSRAHSIIERAFGMMKTRFRAIFLQALEVHHTFVPHVVTACTVLHNICLSAGDVLGAAAEPEEDVEEDEGETDLEAVSGALWRDRLCSEVSALEEVPPGHDYL